MKKKLILIASLVFAFCCLFAFSVNAACAECEDDWTLVFGSKGYLGEITAVNTCPVCGTVSNETIGPLFETLGYSYSEMGGITQRYAVNKAAVARYNEITGTTLKYGAVTAVASNVSGTDVVDKDGNPVGNFALTADLTRKDYDLFNVTVANIPEAYWGEGIICSAYVIAGDYISYINDGVEKQGFVANSLNAVKDLVDNPVAAELPEKIVTLKNGARTELNTVALTPEQLGLGVGGYWNSTSSVNHKYLTVTSVDGDLASRYAYTSMLTKENLPVGSLIVIEAGWAHRANGWTNKCIASYRPEPVNAAYTVATESWWGEHTTKAFNINSGSLSLTDKTVSDIDAIFKIYVPVGAVIPDAPEAPELPKPHWSEDGSLKILTIGNSFSDDAMEYVYYIAKQAGITDVELGNIRRNDCSLANHLEYFNVDNQYAYRHWVNGAEGWDHNWDNDTSIQAVLDDGVAWDFIVFQQVSTSSTDPSTYDDVYKLIELVKPYCPTAKLAWHMTWANKADDGTAYAQILNAVQTKILTNGEIDVVIPTGTAIENAKTSYVSNDLIYRPDGKHLSYGFGRYIAGLTFVKTLTGYSIDSIAAPEADTEGNSLTTGYESAKPSFDFNEDSNDVCIESANNAVKQKLEPIQSLVDEPISVEGLNLVGYLGLSERSVYNSTVAELFFEPITAEKAAAAGVGDLFNGANDPGRYYTTKMFTREMLPNNTVIIIRSGWQYIIDGWSDTSNVGTHSESVTEKYVLVTDEWWGDDVVKAFSIAKYPSDFLSAIAHDEIASNFEIYVPDSAVECNAEGSAEEPKPTNPAYAPAEPDVITDGVTQKGYVSSLAVVDEIVELDIDGDGVVDGQYKALTIEALGFVQGFYNSTDAGGPKLSQTSWASPSFAATRLFTTDTLVNGAVIWIGSNQYRPEGWSNLAEASSPRNNNVKAVSYTVVDADWWSTRYTSDGTEATASRVTLSTPYVARTFNVSKSTSASAESVYEYFKIYIPIDKIETVASTAE